MSGGTVRELNFTIKVVRIFVGRYRRLRTAHPVSVLRWLRNGVLLCVLAAGLLYLWLATQASNDIGATRRTSQAVAYIGFAGTAVTAANSALQNAFTNEDVTLTGTGSEYIDDITQVDKDLTVAAEGNAAGTEGTSKIQFVQDQLATYLQLSEDAVRDYGAGKRFGLAAETYATGGDQSILPAISDLKSTEATAFRAQRGAWPLDPGAFWWVLLGPVIGMLLLTLATIYVLVRYFRRYISLWLLSSLLVTAATAIALGLFNANDERHLSLDPWAGRPATMTGALLLFVVSALLAHLAYRPRLAEYRFESS